MDWLERLREQLLEGAREIETLERVAAEARSPRSVFQGDVTLVIRGIDQTRTLAQLEEELRATPGIDRAKVEHYASGEARIHLTLPDPLDLSAELDRLLPAHTLRVSTHVEAVMGLRGTLGDR